jgi:hypothetical protein
VPPTTAATFTFFASAEVKEVVATFEEEEFEVEICAIWTVKDDVGEDVETDEFVVRVDTAVLPLDNVTVVRAVIRRPVT